MTRNITGALFVAAVVIGAAFLCGVLEVVIMRGLQ